MIFGPPCIYVYIYLSIYFSIYLSIYISSIVQYTYSSNIMYIILSLCLSIYFSIYLVFSIYLSIYLFIYLYLNLYFLQCVNWRLLWLKLVFCLYRYKKVKQRAFSIHQFPYLAFAWNGSYTISHDIYAASQRFLIKLRNYGIDQLYLRKVLHIIFNCVFYIWGGFQNVTLKDILLLYIFW